MIGIDRALRHMAWSNQDLFAHLQTLPVEALSLRYAPTSWSVGGLALHIVGAAEWFRYCLTGEPWTELAKPKTHADLARLAEQIAPLDALLLREAASPDATMTFEDEQGERSALRSTILTQAFMHAGEHRTHIACALDNAGLPTFDLDAHDLWAFEAHDGPSRPVER